jgi:hypothetical protein
LKWDTFMDEDGLVFKLWLSADGISQYDEVGKVATGVVELSPVAATETESKPEETESKAEETQSTRSDGWHKNMKVRGDLYEQEDMYLHTQKSFGVALVENDRDLLRWARFVIQEGEYVFSWIDGMRPYAFKEKVGKDQLKLVDENFKFDESRQGEHHHELYAH